jgi:cyclopropane fatty-acyl-phospholipid synthase-like methyltransferase
MKNRFRSSISPFQILFFLLTALPALAQPGPQPMHQRFDDAERWSKVFDDPERDAWQKPDEVIRAFKLSPDAAVADIGSGTGYFAVRLARALPAGRVFGADLEPDMVRYLNERAAREKLPNLSSHVAAADDPRIPVPVDLALVLNTYHHIGRRQGYFSRLKKSLKPHGRVAIVDFKPDSPIGPPKRHRIAAKAVADEMTRAGYALEASPDFLPYQYLLIFRPR